MADTPTKIDVVVIEGKENWSNWRDTRGEWVYFIDDPKDLKVTTLRSLQKVVYDNPSYRKLSAIFPTVKIKRGESPIYGWTLKETYLLPNRIPASRLPYPSQIGYLNGALIKRTALEKLKPSFTGAILHDSAQFSVDLWEAGLRSLLDPRVSVNAKNEAMQYSIPSTYDVTPETRLLWRREVVI